MRVSLTRMSLNNLNTFIFLRFHRAGVGKASCGIDSRPLARNVPKTAMSFHPTTCHHRSSSFANASKPFAITSQWVPCSGCQSNGRFPGTESVPWCVLNAVSTTVQTRFMRSNLQWLVSSTCIGTHGPRLASTVVLRCQAFLAGPVREQRLGSATHGLLSHALPECDRSKGAGIQRGFHSRFVKSTIPPVLRAYHASTTGSTNTPLYTGDIAFKIFPRASSPIGPLPSRT
jgi:hypothetical protein